MINKNSESSIYGECARHKGQSMFNCSECLLEKNILMNEKDLTKFIDTLSCNQCSLFIEGKCVHSDSEKQYLQRERNKTVVYRNKKY